MKKVVIALGASQHVVSENDVISVTMQKTDKDKLTVPALMVIDGGTVTVGSPHVKDVNVELTVQNQDARADKVTAIRFKAKKRVMKVRGHRQSLIELKVTNIK